MVKNESCQGVMRRGSKTFTFSSFFMSCNAKALKFLSFIVYRNGLQHKFPDKTATILAIKIYHINET